MSAPDWDAVREQGGLLAVSHGYYGCETGCCGWELVYPEGHARFGDRPAWTFAHPPDVSDSAALIEWAREEFVVPDDVKIILGESIVDC